MPSDLLHQSHLLTGPWILYDGTCSICRGGAARFGPLLRRRGFRLETLQSPLAREFISDAADEMKVVTRGGTIFGGAHAVCHIAAHIWWARPLAWLWRIPACRDWLNRGYQWIAARRHCRDGSCRIET